MRKILSAIAVVMVALVLGGYGDLDAWLPSQQSTSSASAGIAWEQLPAEAHVTLAHIRDGGPHPYPQDGSRFGNYEGHLPQKPNDYYREYTVDTPGIRHRGTRRIVTGGRPPVVYYYTDDHYASFRRIHMPDDVE